MQSFLHKYQKQGLSFLDHRVHGPSPLRELSCHGRKKVRSKLWQHDLPTLCPLGHDGSSIKESTDVDVKQIEVSQNYQKSQKSLVSCHQASREERNAEDESLVCLSFMCCRIWLSKLGEMSLSSIALCCLKPVLPDTVRQDTACPFWVSSGIHALACSCTFPSGPEKT